MPISVVLALAFKPGDKVSPDEYPWSSEGSRNCSLVPRSQQVRQDLIALNAANRWKESPWAASKGNQHRAKNLNIEKTSLVRLEAGIASLTATSGLLPGWELGLMCYVKAILNVSPGCR